jgi:DNA-binding LytR/AlgR family response regulator
MLQGDAQITVDVPEARDGEGGNARQTAGPWHMRPFPRNYLIANPLAGAVVLAGFSWLFLILYRPLDAQASAYFPYELTMALYSIAGALAAFAAIHLLRSVRYYSAATEWTILKEVSAIGLVLLFVGTAVFFAAFLIEAPADRWNVATALDSYAMTILVGAIPFGLVTLINLNRLFEVTTNLSQNSLGPGLAAADEWIEIETPLKKDEVAFPAAAFLYAVSEGNYVTFHLWSGERARRLTARISINSVEEQLARHRGILRTHRSFIVNLRKVSSASGNSLGYRLKVPGAGEEIPVSRTHVRRFRSMYRVFS